MIGTPITIDVQLARRKLQTLEGTLRELSKQFEDAERWDCIAEGGRECAMRMMSHLVLMGRKAMELECSLYTQREVDDYLDRRRVDESADWPQG